MSNRGGYRGGAAAGRGGQQQHMNAQPMNRGFQGGYEQESSGISSNVRSHN